MHYSNLFAGVSLLVLTAAAPLVPRNVTGQAPAKQYYRCSSNGFQGYCSVDPCALKWCPDSTENVDPSPCPKGETLYSCSSGLQGCYTSNPCPPEVRTDRCRPGEGFYQVCANGFKGCSKYDECSKPSIYHSNSTYTNNTQYNNQYNSQYNSQTNSQTNTNVNTNVDNSNHVNIDDHSTNVDDHSNNSVNIDSHDQSNSYSSNSYNPQTTNNNNNQQTTANNNYQNQQTTANNNYQNQQTTANNNCQNAQYPAGNKGSCPCQCGCQCRH